MAGCLAGFIGQLAAFGATTNSVWDVTSISTFKAGKTKVIETNAATAMFLSDGTCSLKIGTNEFAGAYTNTTKKLTLTLGAGGLGAMKTNALELIQAQVPSATLTVKSVKFSSKIKLSTNGVPVKATSTVSGKGCEFIGGKNRCKGFSLKTLWADWTLSSGTNF
jgi:hypothetical protein